MAESKEKSKLELITKFIRTFPDFPSKGIVFRDICPIMKNPAALTAAVDLFEQHVRETHPHVDYIRLGVGFVMVRKKGKLPGPTVSIGYTLEYSTAEAEIQEDAISPGDKVVLIDDLLATGGTLFAACELMKKQRAEVLGCLVVIQLSDLGGADKLNPHTLFSLAISMIRAGFFSATNTVLRMRESSCSLDIIKRRCSWAGFLVMVASSFWASFAR
ncbi:hypothetical protein CRUP_000534, partial [Coryphaenoides rupestris]